MPRRPRHPLSPSALPAARRTRRAFTVLELIAALVLGSVVVITAGSLFWMLSSSDRRVGERMGEASDLAITQTVLRRALGGMLAAKPKDPSPTDKFNEQPQEGDELDPDQQAEQAESEDMQELVESVTGDPELAADLLAGVDTDERPNFELYFDDSRGATLPMLELKVIESPVPSGDLTGLEATLDQYLSVRGVFETLEQGDGSLLLQWRPLQPPGKPFVLVRDLARVEWYVLPRSRHGKEWVDVYAAYLQEYYPIAVRLVLFTKTGGYADWLFDTAVTTPETAR